MADRQHTQRVKDLRKGRVTEMPKKAPAKKPVPVKATPKKPPRRATTVYTPSDEQEREAAEHETNQVPVEGKVPQTMSSSQIPGQNRVMPRQGPATFGGNAEPVPTITVPASTRPMSPNELVAQPPGFSEAVREAAAKEGGATGAPPKDEEEEEEDDEQKDK